MFCVKLYLAVQYWSFLDRIGGREGVQMRSHEPDVEEAGPVVDDLAVLALVVRDTLISVGPVCCARVGGQRWSRGRLNVLSLSVAASGQTIVNLVSKKISCQSIKELCLKHFNFYHR